MKRRLLTGLVSLIALLFALAAPLAVPWASALPGMGGEKGAAKTSDSVKPSIKELATAAEAGDREALYRLGYIYEKGLGITRDYAKARTLYLKAAGDGHTGAMVRLGKMYAEAHGVKRDYKEAARWFTEAAEKGDPQAQYNLGLLFLGGDGVPRDYVMSYMWFNLAGAAGIEPARKKLDRLEAKMPPGQVELAQRLSREFKVK